MEVDATRMRAFEATVYNKLVRDALETTGFNMTGFDDTWAESRIIEVRGITLEAAWKTINRDYPKEAGFVIIAIIELAEYS